MIVYVRQEYSETFYLFSKFSNCSNYYDKIPIHTTPYIEVDLINEIWTRITKRDVTIISLDELTTIHQSIEREKIINNILN